METILAFVGFVVVAGFVYFKFVKKKKIAVSVDGKTVVDAVKPTAPVEAEVPTSVEVSTPVEVKGVAVSNYTDPYPNKTLAELQADFSAEIDVQNKFVAGLKPGEYIGATPNWATAKNDPSNPDKSRDISKERDDIRYKITSLATAIRHRGGVVPAGDTSGRKK